MRTNALLKHTQTSSPASALLKPAQHVDSQPVVNVYLLCVLHLQQAASTTTPLRFNVHMQAAVCR
jgi:hypothetical protein